MNRIELESHIRVILDEELNIGSIKDRTGKELPLGYVANQIIKHANERPVDIVKKIRLDKNLPVQPAPNMTQAAVITDFAKKIYDWIAAMNKVANSGNFNHILYALCNIQILIENFKCECGIQDCYAELVKETLNANLEKRECNYDPYIELPF